MCFGVPKALFNICLSVLYATANYLAKRLVILENLRPVDAEDQSQSLYIVRKNVLPNKLDIEI